jgi:hypothetical protein
MAEKKKIIREYAPRYRMAAKSEKTRLLNEYLALAGGNRKYAIYRLNREGKRQLRWVDGEYVNVEISGRTRKKRVYKPFYDKEVAAALVKLWRFFMQVCGERLVPLLRANIDDPQVRSKFPMSEEVRDKLKKISKSTVERLLKDEREKNKIKGTCTTKRGALLKNQIPVRVFWNWDDKKPGFCEIDTVSHDGGGAVSSEYAWSLTATDVALCWTEVRALKNKARKWTSEAIEDIRAAFPVPIRGFDSDGGPEFINWHFKAWCDKNTITFTRGRAYHSNDNCFVEQKNGDVIRKTVGYARFEGEAALGALMEVYRCLCPLLNYFYPNKKLERKETLPNGRVKKIYEKQLKTPYARVLEHPDIQDENKDRVRLIKAGLNIVDLQECLDAACNHLDRIVRRRHTVQANKQQDNGQQDG